MCTAMTRPGSLFLPQQDDTGDDASKVRHGLAVLDACIKQRSY
jgi:hypothetical protein